MPTTATITARHHTRVGAAVAALLLLLSACGGGDGGEDDLAATSPTTVPADQTTGGDANPTTIAAPVNRSMVPTSRVEVRRGQPLAKIQLDGPPANGMVTEDGVWVATEAETLLRIDPATNQIVHEIAAPGLTFPFDIGWGAAWIPDFDNSVVRRVDLVSGAVIATIPTGDNPAGVEVSADAVWVANHRAGTVTRIDPSTNLVIATVEVGPAGPAGPQHLVAFGDRLWVGVPNAKEVVAIDATTNQVVERVAAEMPCGPIEEVGGDLWVTSCFEAEFVDVIDTVGPMHRGSVDAGGAVGSVMQVDDLVWITAIQLPTGPTGALIGINPYTRQVMDRLIVDDPAYTAVVGFDSVWMFSFEAEAVVRLPLDALRSDG